ncbi:MAG: hypothetical protein AAFX39_14575 [Pseudomonadota bacterium]
MMTITAMTVDVGPAIEVTAWLDMAAVKTAMAVIAMAPIVSTMMDLRDRRIRAVGLCGGNGRRYQGRCGRRARQEKTPSQHCASDKMGETDHICLLDADIRAF